MTLQLIVFIVLALFIAVCSVLAVTTSRILRAATYLLFVLFGTAGIYFQLNYSFLGAVQLLIYAGGITVLYVFSILLTSSQGDKSERLKNGKMVAGAVSTLAGLGICLYVEKRVSPLPLHSRRTACADHRPHIDGNGEISICTAFRSNQHIAAGLHCGRYNDCT